MAAEITRRSAADGLDESAAHDLNVAADKRLQIRRPRVEQDQ